MKLWTTILKNVLGGGNGTLLIFNLLFSYLFNNQITLNTLKIDIHKNLRTLLSSSHHALHHFNHKCMNMCMEIV